MLKAILFLLLIVNLSYESNLCPAGCFCGIPEIRDDTRARAYDEVVDCTGKGYTEIPYWDIDCDTKIIRFADNNLTRITRSSFRGLQQLEYIYLENNQIDYIETAAFAGLPNLKDVILVDNLFDEIDERPFWDGEFENIIVQLDGNPFYCNHHLKRTVYQIESKVTLSGIICADGERRRPVMRRRNKVDGHPFYLVEDVLRHRLFSWELGLWAGGAWALFWICMVLIYFFWTCKDGKYRKMYGASVKKAKNETWIRAKALTKNEEENGRLEFQLEEPYEYDTQNDDMRYAYPNQQTVETDDRFLAGGPDADAFNDGAVGSGDQRRPFTPQKSYERNGTPGSRDGRPGSSRRHEVEEPDYHHYSVPRTQTREPDYRESIREQSYYPNHNKKFSANARMNEVEDERVGQQAGASVNVQGQRGFRDPRATPEQFDI